LYPIYAVPLTVLVGTVEGEDEVGPPLLVLIEARLDDEIGLE